MNDPLYKIDKFLNKWRDRFTIDNPRYAQRYREEPFYFVIVFQWIGWPKKYVAIFHALDLSCLQKLSWERYVRDNRPVTQSDITAQVGGCDLARVHGDMCRDGRDQELMLIGDVQVMQDPEGFVPVPTLVWLQPLDRFAEGLLHTLFYTPEGFFEMLGTIPDREGVMGFDLISVMSDKVADQYIECRSEVMEQVAQNQGNAQGQWANYLEAMHLFPIGLDLLGDGVVVRAIPVQTMGFIDKIDKVLFGPANLSPGAGRWVAHD